MHLTLPDINPVIFQVSIVAVRWYAVAYVAGIVLGWLYIGKLLRTESLWAPRTPPATTVQLDDLILWITAGIILGGRIGYILAYDMSIMWRDPVEVFMIQHGGMSFHGGFTGVAIATIIYCRWQKFTPAQMLSLGDVLACAAPIGLFLGRLANFVNGELWGRPTSLPWGMDFCNKYILQQYQGTCPADPDGIPVFRHPSQLYEALGEGLILFGVCAFLAWRLNKLQKPGLIMGVFIAGYGLIRIMLESVRNPDEQMLPFFKIITMGTLLSIPMVLVGGFLIWQATRTIEANRVA